MCVNGKRRTLGFFYIEELAAREYDQAAIAHGLYDCLNFDDYDLASQADPAGDAVGAPGASSNTCLGSADKPLEPQAPPIIEPLAEMVEAGVGVRGEGELVGCRVEVWWDRYQAHFPGVLSAYVTQGKYKSYYKVRAAL